MTYGWPRRALEEPEVIYQKGQDLIRVRCGGIETMHIGMSLLFFLQGKTLTGAHSNPSTQI